jgi:hypothetical protein
VRQTTKDLRVVILFAAVAALGVAGCGSSGKGGAAAKTTTPSTVATGPGGHIAKPVSTDPSTSAKMICEEDVRNEIYSLVGVKPTQPLNGTWVDHVYSCKYVYANGSMTLSVKELADKGETDAYFASLAQSLHKVKTIQSLGQGAFTTTNQSAVVRKDYKVLTVDVSGLPAQFGDPPDPRGNVALNVAATIMSCWTGA